MRLHTVCMEYSGCLPTLLSPLAERTCFSKVFYALMSIGTYLVCSVVRVAVLAVHFPLLRRMGYGCLNL